MFQPRYLAAFAMLFLLAACNKSSSSLADDSYQPVSIDSGENSIPIKIPPPKFDRYGNRLYTDEELRLFPAKRYDGFPDRIARLMKQQEIDQVWCTGSGAGDDPEAMRACNRAETLLYRIGQLGFCLGSEDAMAVEADDHWLKCSAEAHYVRNAPLTPPALFSEEEIAEAERLARDRAHHKDSHP